MTKSGLETKFHRFIRSDLPADLQQNEIDYLLRNNIRTVIDLRNEKEFSRKKSDLNSSEFDYINIALRGGKAPDSEEDIPSGYIYIIDDKEKMNEVFTAISSSENSVFFNCAAGKDRTGVIAMLLFLIADVYDSDIIADYQVSYTYLREKMKKMHSDFPELPAFLGCSKMEYMEKTLILFRDKYKNINSYMEYIGMAPDKVRIIRDKMLTE